MSGTRRRDTEDSVPAAIAYSDPASAELLDLLSAEGREHLESFSDEDQRLFSELVEDCGSELQSELLRRSLAARHSPKELHAFADQIRGLDDEDLYAAVTLEEVGPGGARRGVVQRMRAEADPIYGFTLNGHTLTGDGDGTGFDALGLPVRPRASFSAPPVLSIQNTDFENSIARGKAISRRELGESAEPPSSVRNRVVPPAPAAVTGADPFTQAVKALGYSYREVAVDAAFPLGKAVDGLIAALKRGLPVPATLGSVNGSGRRAVLFLQVAAAGTGHAVQLHEPVSNETVWVNEAALRNSGELPLSNKTLRRLVNLALPKSKEGK